MDFFDEFQKKLPMASFGGHRMNQTDTIKALQEALLVRAGGLRRYLRERIPSRLSSSVNVDDIVQDVWIAAFRHVDDFADDGESAFDRWLQTIANRKLLDAIKRARRWRRADDKRQTPPVPPDQSRSFP